MEEQGYIRQMDGSSVISELGLNEKERIMPESADAAREFQEDEERARQWEEEDAEERAAWEVSRRDQEVVETEPELSKEETSHLLERQYEQALKQVCYHGTLLVEQSNNNRLEVK